MVVDEKDYTALARRAAYHDNLLVTVESALANWIGSKEGTEKRVNAEEELARMWEVLLNSGYGKKDKKKVEPIEPLPNPEKSWNPVHLLIQGFLESNPNGILITSDGQNDIRICKNSKMEGDSLFIFSKQGGPDGDFEWSEVKDQLLMWDTGELFIK